jgi:hypothetical protein
LVLEKKNTCKENENSFLGEKILKHIIMELACNEKVSSATAE